MMVDAPGYEYPKNGKDDAPKKGQKVSSMRDFFNKKINEQQ